MRLFTSSTVLAVMRTDAHNFMQESRKRRVRMSYNWRHSFRPRQEESHSSQCRRRYRAANLFSSSNWWTRCSPEAHLWQWPSHPLRKDREARARPRSRSCLASHAKGSSPRKANWWSPIDLIPCKMSVRFIFKLHRCASKRWFALVIYIYTLVKLHEYKLASIK